MNEDRKLSHAEHYDLYQRNLRLFHEILKPLHDPEPSHMTAPCDRAAWAIVILYYSALHLVMGTLLALGIEHYLLTTHKGIMEQMNASDTKLTEIANAFRMLLQNSWLVRYVGTLFKGQQAQAFHDDLFVDIEKICLQLQDSLES